MNQLLPDEEALLNDYRSVKLSSSGHGRLMVEIRDRQAQMVEITHKKKY